MKRKYILAAAALAVLCAGVAAYSINQNTELPSSTPNSSSAPSSVASSEPESGSTSVTDNRDIAKAENFVAYQVYKEETTAGTGTGAETNPKDDIEPSQEELDAVHNQAVEKFINRYMDETGASREKAEAWWQNRQEEADAKNEEAQRKREEYNQRIQAETQAHLDAIDQWYRENTGMSRADWLKLSIDERTSWVFAHPDVDFSTSPEFQ